MNIDNNCVVTLQFTLTDSEGNEIHRTTSQEPMMYLHGWGELIDGLEAALVGKAAGDELEVTVTPEEGYGDPDPQLIQSYPVENFGATDLRVGMELQGKDSEGNFRLLTVTKIGNEEVTVDMNHPLAGKTLTFNVQVEDVREATESELAHGHVHLDGDEHH